MLTRVKAMLIRARAPLRLGFAGGGTDVSPYSDTYGGYVLNATIDKYAYAILEPSSDGLVEFIASDQEKVCRFEAHQPVIDGSNDLKLHTAVYNRLVRDFNHGKPMSLRLTTFADAPPGSGLGSSSTLVVAMITAFVEYLRLPLGEYDIAQLAYQIERFDAGFSGGKQDQYAATFGGFNFMEFYGNDRVIVNPLRIKDWIVSELEASTVLYFTGVSRASAEIIDEQKQNVIKENTVALEAMHELKHEALVMKEALLKGDFELLAQSLRHGWEFKKRMAQNISNPQIESIYEIAIKAGAKAGRISGAGGGGFMIFLVDPAKRMNVIRALGEYGGTTMNFHFTNHGAQRWTIV